MNEAPWGHSVRRLLARFLERQHISGEGELLSLAGELDIHYIPSRYPNAHPSGAPHEVYDERIALDLLKAAEKIVEFAKRFLEL